MVITSLPLPQKEAGRLNTLVKLQPEFTPIDGLFSAGNNTQCSDTCLRVTGYRNLAAADGGQVGLGKVFNTQAVCAAGNVGLPSPALIY